MLLPMHGRPTCADAAGPRATPGPGASMQRSCNPGCRVSPRPAAIHPCLRGGFRSWPGPRRAGTDRPCSACTTSRPTASPSPRRPYTCRPFRTALIPPHDHPSLPLPIRRRCAALALPLDWLACSDRVAVRIRPTAASVAGSRLDVAVYLHDPGARASHVRCTCTSEAFGTQRDRDACALCCRARFVYPGDPRPLACATSPSAAPALARACRLACVSCRDPATFAPAGFRGLVFLLIFQYLPASRPFGQLNATASPSISLSPAIVGNLLRDWLAERDLRPPRCATQPFRRRVELRESTPVRSADPWIAADHCR